MSQLPISQQTATAITIQGELARTAPEPEALPHVAFAGPLQWVLEGSGWDLLRPLVDGLMLSAAVVLASGGLYAAAHPSARTAPVLALPLVVILLFYLRGLYRSQLRVLVLDGVVPVLSAISVGVMTIAIMGLFIGSAAPPQNLTVRLWVFALVAVGAGRVTLAFTRSWARAHRVVGKPVLIVGAGMVGAQVARRLETHPEYGLTPVGFLDEDPRSVAEVGGRDVPVLGTLEDLDETVLRTGVRNVIVAFSSVADARVSRLLQHCHELGIEVSVVPRMFDTINNRVGYDTVGGLPLMSFTIVNPRGWQFSIKYALDRVFAAAILLLLSPLLVTIALVIKLTSQGPLLFRQPRVGLDGREFEMLKFRTMRGSPEEHGESDAEWAERILDAEGFDDAACIYGHEKSASAPEDDRRTAFGRLLRSLSMDELPQLWNVVIGDMSLIGPRPERASYVRQFEGVVQRYGDRHRVKSGITGWAQVHGLRGQTSLDERVEWDNYYIAHWSLGLDLKIIALTVVALLHRAE
jgi:exopolysaccharide biosynthesis polyprenyl glycosylphosphotransferase